MRNLNLTAFVYIFVGVSAALWVGIALATGVDFTRLWDFFKLLPKVISIDLLLVFIFTKWAWRWRLFQRWLVPFPDLNGTWEGHIRTTWSDPETGLQPDRIPAILTIKQSFTRISCVMRTAEMTSYSYAEGFRIDRDRQLRQLAYSYTSKARPGIADRSIPHEGTILLNMLGEPATGLSGQYWTDRKSTGEVTLRFRERKLADDLPEDLPTHPVSRSQQEKGDRLLCWFRLFPGGCAANGTGVGGDAWERQPWDTAGGGTMGKIGDANRISSALRRKAQRPSDGLG